MTKILTFHSDPGHGWLEVPKQLLQEVGYAPSRCSYQSFFAETVYLEEDCDATLFSERAKEKGFNFKIVHESHSELCFIRRLSRMSGVGHVSPFRSEG
jgi:hypothetical protein